MKKIAILASGNGTNAVNILQYFYNSNSVSVAGVFSNKMTARVLEKFIDRDRSAYYFENNEELLEQLESEKIDIVVLAGYLKLIPSELITRYPNAIVNIHPSLLPKHGGPGMYAMHVHKAVKNAGDDKSGITIHLVNEKYDDGKILFQSEIDVLPEDSAQTIAKKVQLLEHKHYPEIIEKLAKNEF